MAIFRSLTFKIVQNFRPSFARAVYFFNSKKKFLNLGIDLPLFRSVVKLEELCKPPPPSRQKTWKFFLFMLIFSHGTLKNALIT